MIGGGDTALSDALYLAKTSAKVYIIHRRNEFRANNTLVKKVSETDNIELILEAIPLEICGDESVSGVKISQNDSERIVETGGVFVAVGSLPNTGLLNGIAELDEHCYIKADENGVTSAEGLFAAGDVRTKQVRQVITAAADGANSVVSACEYLNK